MEIAGFGGLEMTFIGFINASAYWKQYALRTWPICLYNSNTSCFENTLTSNPGALSHDRTQQTA